MEDFPRHIGGAVREALADTPVVVVQGARQVGKSTLVGKVAAEFDAATWLSLDDPGTLTVASDDPVFFVAQAGDRLMVVDEAQRAPEIVLPLKANVDRDRRPGRFLLTGSADLLTVKGAGDSLAGRAETIELLPLSQGEMASTASAEDFVSWLLAGAPGHDFTALDVDAVITGGYPEAVRRSPRRRAAWFDSYVSRLAGHDARDLAGGGYADHMNGLLRLVAAGGQAELVNARLARGLGIAETTVASYLRTAEAMRLVTRLPAWGRSARSRLVRRPKVSLNDSGLSAHLSGLTREKALTVGGREHFGSLLEQFVTLELRKQQGWSAERFSLHHFRDHGGLEVDLVVELADGRIVAVEVKSTTSITARSWSGLERFRMEFPDRDITGVVLHGGREVLSPYPWLHVLPVTALWEHAQG